MLAKITSRNQLTMPKAMLKEFPDAKYFDVGCAAKSKPPRLLRFKLSVQDGEGLLAVVQDSDDSKPAADNTEMPRSMRHPVSLARAGRKADAVVTGDADLLTLRSGFTVPILTTDQLKERLERR
jgi:hypothetical protein